jgi:hypothetical protein
MLTLDRRMLLRAGSAAVGHFYEMGFMRRTVT